MMDEARATQLREFASRLGITIVNLELLDQALTHASLSVEPGGPEYNYESLEFLGDAALGLAIANHLYLTHPDRTPGQYSRMRAGIVNRRCLARIARELEIAPVIQLGRGEELSGGRERSALLADCLEALLGALYLDQGWEVTQRFVVRVFQKELEREENADRVWDFKSRLQNYCQAERIDLPQFVLVRCEGPDHRKEFEVEVTVRGLPSGRGKGTTKKEAEQNAARAALEHEGLLFG